MPSPAAGNAGLADPLLGARPVGAKDKYWVPADEEEVVAAAECDGEDGRPLLYRTFKVKGVLLHPYRLLTLVRSIVIVQFFIWRMRHRDSDSMFLWWITIAGDFWFGVNWLLNQGSKLNPIKRVPNIALLNQHFDPASGVSSSSQLPGVDVFINTVDPVDESVLYTMNSVLSILATDYPVDRYATYLSDDGGSLVHYEALLETARFATLWAPFCRKHRVEPRAPESYFAAKAGGPYAAKAPEEFVGDRRRVRREYEEFKARLEALFSVIPQRSEAYGREGTKGGAKATYMADGTLWPGTWIEPAENHKKGQHAAVVQVMLNHPSNEPQLGMPASVDNPLDFSGVDVRLPMLAYIAREKRPGCDHQKKAGAMNVQLRVSALLSNAPFAVNFDCDHYINNSQAFRAAACFMLDRRHGDDTAFVQFPQRSDDVDPTDRYCNHNRVFFDATSLGLNGIQGPSNVGTGCMFRRAALYGADPPRWRPDGAKVMDNPSRQFGSSAPFISSVPLATNQERPITPPASLDDRVAAELADVTACAYEDGTEWGNGVGWVYNIATEDVVTGFRLHRKGWRSEYCAMEPDAFRGTAPINLTERLYQILRWSAGSLEMFFSRFCPLLAGRRLHLMQRVAYTNMTAYPISAAFIFIYDLLPAMWLFLGEFQIQRPFQTYALYLIIGMAMMEITGMVEIKWAGLTLLDWCRNEQFYMIGATSVYPAAVLHNLLWLVGLKGLPFKVTSKQLTASGGGGARERFAELYDVQWAPLLVPTVVVIAVNVVAIGAAAGKAVTFGWSFAQVASASSGLLFNVWILLMLYPFALGIMGRWSKRPYLLFVLLVVAIAAIALAYVALLAVLALGSIPPLRLGRWPGGGGIVSRANWRV